MASTSRIRVVSQSPILDDLVADEIDELDVAPRFVPLDLTPRVRASPKSILRKSDPEPVPAPPTKGGPVRRGYGSVMSNTVKEAPGDKKDDKRLARWKKTSSTHSKWKLKAKRLQDEVGKKQVEAAKKQKEVVEKQQEAAKAQAKCDKLAALLAKQDELDEQMSEESN